MKNLYYLPLFFIGIVAAAQLQVIAARAGALAHLVRQTIVQRRPWKATIIVI